MSTELMKEQGPRNLSTLSTADTEEVLSLEGDQAKQAANVFREFLRVHSSHGDVRGLYYKSESLSRSPVLNAGMLEPYGEIPARTGLLIMKDVAQGLVLEKEEARAYHKELSALVAGYTADDKVLLGKYEHVISPTVIGAEVNKLVSAKKLTEAQGDELLSTAADLFKAAKENALAQKTAGAAQQGVNQSEIAVPRGVVAALAHVAWEVGQAALGTIRGLGLAREANNKNANRGN